MADERPVDQQLWANLGFIRNNTDRQYVIDVLEARRDFLRLKRREELAIRQVYISAASDVAKLLERFGHEVAPLTRNHWRALEKELTRAADEIHEALTRTVRESLVEAVKLGSRPIDSQLVRALRQAEAPIEFTHLQRGFAEVNREAVEALWARTHKGIRVSERIWKTSRDAKKSIRDLIQVGIASGRDTVEIARDLQRYVRNGIGTLAQDYPQMMARMGRRIPKNLNYEALRLVRTERAKAYTEGTYSRGRVNPSYLGAKWMLSDAHPVYDICDTLATQDLYKMGPGVYPKGEEPTHPHPNCLCFVVPVLEDTNDFVDRLIAWKNDPSTQPELQEWYEEVYLPIAVSR